MSLRKSFQAKPEPLRVKHQQLNRCARAITKQEQQPGKWILIELLSADGNQPVNAFAEINGWNARSILS
jgi:hypothetical protein